MQHHFLPQEHEEPVTDRPSSPSESQAAFKQLQDELRDVEHVYRPFDVQTDSQFENGWHTLQLPPITTPPASSLHTVSSPVKPHQNSQSYEDRGDMALVHANSLRVKEEKERVPPSLHDFLQCSSQNIPSSPPPMPLPTSSPLTTRSVKDDKEDTGKIYEWNANARLTESQLLPESLMNDSMFVPPQEWDDIVEEDFEAGYERDDAS